MTVGVIPLPKEIVGGLTMYPVLVDGEGGLLNVPGMGVCAAIAPLNNRMERASIHLRITDLPTKRCAE
jgi:hypothetical protein